MTGIHEGAIDMSGEESDAVGLLEDVVSITRRDPGETGPLLVTTVLGEHLVNDDGKTEEI